jgi:transcriptional regulator with XRE-family HTH domain
LRAMRRIAGLTAQDMAEKMGEKTSAETLSRWENEKQPMGGYAEKVFRLVICDELRNRARGVPYHDGAIARLVVVDPWRADAEFEVPAIVVSRVKMRSEVDRSIIEAWADAA